jgi:hypothetical protein
MPNFWTVKVVVGSLDTTARLTGQVSIRCIEDSASSASFTVLPFDGIVDLTNHIGQTVTIDYNGHRRFTGLVDTVDYDPDTTLTSFSCTDGLQLVFERIEGATLQAVGDATVALIAEENARNQVMYTLSIGTYTQTYVDSAALAAEERVSRKRIALALAKKRTGIEVRKVVGGLWSSSVFSGTSGWDAFHDCMSTQLASYNLDSNGQGVNTPWLAKPSPDFTFTEDGYLDQSLKVGNIANARDIVNSVDLQFEYRYTRLWQCQFQLSWGVAFSTIVAAVFGNPYSWGLCDHKRVVDALNGAGFCLRTQRGLNGRTLALGPGSGIDFTPIPAPQYATVPGGQPLGAGYMADVPRFSAITAFSCAALKRYRQTRTETVILSVTCPQSVRQTGRMNRVVTHGVESSTQPNAITQELTDHWEETVTDTLAYPVSRQGVAAGVQAGSFAGQVVQDVQLSLNRFAFYEPAQASTQGASPGLAGSQSEFWDMTQSPVDGRAERDNAFATAKAAAIRTIVESHRANEVSFTVEAHESLELSHTVSVTRTAPHFRAKGKVRELTHTYDIESGSALTEVTLALVKSWSTGVHYVEPYIPLPDTSTKIYKGIWTGGNLSTWPVRDEALVGMGSPAERESVPPDSARFRGYNFFTSEFVIEGPPIPQEAQATFTSIARTSEELVLPDDEFTVAA